MGEAVEPIRGHANVAWMHGMRDLVAAGQEMLAGRLSPLSYMRGWRQPLVFAAFAKDDPLPGVVDLPILLWRLLARGAEIARGTSAFRRSPLQKRCGTPPLGAFTGARRKG
jgi:predicted ATP-grasp superfamily ATP-dependent carboligase